MRYKPKLLEFVDSSFKDTKTKRWAVCTDRDGAIGRIQWFGRWRKYVYYPKHGTFYDHKCQREIADFTELETKKHKEALKNEKMES